VRIVKLSEVCKVVSGSTPKRERTEYWGGDIPWVTPKEITRLSSAFLCESVEKITEAGFKSCSTTMLPVGSLLLSSRAPIGLLAINKIPVCTNQGFKSLIPGKEVIVEYLYFFLKHNVSSLQAKGNGATFKELAKPAVEDFPISLPPLDDQIRIAHLLGKVEGLIAQRKQHLQQLDDLLKSVFLDMFGDPVRNEKGWEKKTAIDYAECIVPGRDKPKSFSGGTPWVTTGDLQHLAYTGKSRDDIGLSGDEIKEVRARVVPKSSVLLTCVGDLGVVSVCTSDMVVNQQLHAFQVSNTMNAEFFMYSLSFQKKYMYQNASQTTVPYMNKTICNSIPIIRPPQELQLKFAEIFKNVHGIKSRYQQSLTDLEALYGALSQQAFKGELDLSRVPLLDIEPEEEKAVVTEPLQARAEASLAINLPDISVLLDAVQGPVRQQDILRFWLESYRGQLGSTPFSVQQFMAAAQTRLAEQHPDNDFELGANDYEHIKNWVFGALADGRLQQSRDITGHDESGEPIFGNLIEIQCGALL
jgi:type I restriction enzyme S subunit